METTTGMTTTAKLLHDCALVAAQDAFGRVLCVQAFEMHETIQGVREKMATQYQAATAHPFPVRRDAGSTGAPCERHALAAGARGGEGVV